MDRFVSGWVSDPSWVRASIQERTERGQAVMGSAYCARNTLLPGTWKRMVDEGQTGIFLRDAEKEVIGRYRRPWLQESGTCVSRGMARGIQTSTDVSIYNLSLLRLVEIAWAPIYTLARHEIGRDRCGSGDGAILADAARAVHDIGIATSDLFAGMDEVSIERLAVRRAAPGVGTPQDWIDACKGHTCVTFWPEVISLLADCIAAGYAVPYAHNFITGMPNVNGMSDLGKYGPHCRCFTSVFLDANGETQFGSSESWGEYPAGQPRVEDRSMPIDEIPCVTLRYAGGVRKLPPGEVGVFAQRWWDQIQDGGEAWAVGPANYKSAGV